MSSGMPKNRLPGVRAGERSEDRLPRAGPAVSSSSSSSVDKREKEQQPQLQPNPAKPRLPPFPGAVERYGATREHAAMLAEARMDPELPDVVKQVLKKSGVNADPNYLKHTGVYCKLTAALFAKEAAKRTALPETEPPALGADFAKNVHALPRPLGPLTLTKEETEARGKVVQHLYEAGILLSAEAIKNIFDPTAWVILTGFAVAKGDGFGGFIAPLLSASGPVLAASMQLTVHLLQQLDAAGIKAVHVDVSRSAFKYDQCDAGFPDGEIEAQRLFAALLAQCGFVTTISQGSLASDALRYSSKLVNVGQHFGSPAGRERDWQMLGKNLVAHLYHPQMQLVTFCGEHLAMTVSAMVDTAVHKLLLYHGIAVPERWRSSVSKCAELGKKGYKGTWTAKDLAVATRALELIVGKALEPGETPTVLRDLAAMVGVNTQEEAAAYVFRTEKANSRGLPSIAAVACSVLGICGGEVVAQACEDGKELNLTKPEMMQELLAAALAAGKGCKIKAVTDLLNDPEFQRRHGLHSLNAADKGKLAIWAACEAGGEVVAQACEDGKKLYLKKPEMMQELLAAALAAGKGCKIKAVTDLLNDPEFQRRHGLHSLNAADKGKLAIWAACEAGGEVVAQACEDGKELNLTKPEMMQELLAAALAAGKGCKIKAVTDLLNDPEFQRRHGLHSLNAADKGKLAIWAACEAGGEVVAQACEDGKKLYLKKPEMMLKLVAAAREADKGCKIKAVTDLLNDPEFLRLHDLKPFNPDDAGKLAIWAACEAGGETVQLACEHGDQVRRDNPGLTKELFAALAAGGGAKGHTKEAVTTLLGSATFQGQHASQLEGLDEHKLGIWAACKASGAAGGVASALAFEDGQKLFEKGGEVADLLKQVIRAGFDARPAYIAGTTAKIEQLASQFKILGVKLSLARLATWAARRAFDDRNQIERKDASEARPQEQVLKDNEKAARMMALFKNQAENVHARKKRRE